MAKLKNISREELDLLQEDQDFFDEPEKQWGNPWIKSPKKIGFKSKRQKELFELILNHELTISKGPAGCGKSFISAMAAIQCLRDPEHKIEKIYVMTPGVTAGEDRGFLPGSLEEKMAPFLASTYSAIQKIVGPEQYVKMKSKGLISFKTFAYIRGENLDNCVVIAEEMQNSTITQAKVLLTRIGTNAKIIISGDTSQTDLKLRGSKENGLEYLTNSLWGNPNLDDFLAIHEFGPEDSVARNKFLPHILSSFERYDAIHRGEPGVY